MVGSVTYLYGPIFVPCSYVVMYIRYCMVLLDEIPQDEEHVYISLPLLIIYTIIAVFGIVFATICLILNLWLRNHKYVAILLYNN